MADERSGFSNGQVMVALIGAAAVLGSAVIANSDRLFGPRAEVQQTPVALQGPAPAAAAGSNGAPQPAPAPAVVAASSMPAVANMAGAWRGEDGSVWTFRQEGDRFSTERAEGDERITIEGQVSGRTVRTWVDYFRSDTGGLGLRIMNCDGRLDENAQRVEYSCLNPQTNVTTRANWSRL